MRGIWSGRYSHQRIWLLLFLKDGSRSVILLEGCQFRSFHILKPSGVEVTYSLVLCTWRIAGIIVSIGSHSQAALGISYFKFTFFLCSTWSGSALMVEALDREDRNGRRIMYWLWIRRDGRDSASKMISLLRKKSRRLWKEKVCIGRWRKVGSSRCSVEISRALTDGLSR